MEGLWRFLIVAGCALIPLSLVCQGQSSPSENYVITTAAGGGTVDPRDGGPATEALLLSLRGLAFDREGNLYIAGRHRVRKGDTSGTISTFAGTGERGFSGDGGPATQAQLASPVDVATDDAGNIYIADTFNDRIRRIDPSGTISTAVRISRPRGVVLDPAGNIYVSSGDLVRRVDLSGAISTVAGGGNKSGTSADGGPATEARLNVPLGLARDNAGNLYFVDSEVIRRVTPDGNIHTVAGTGEGGFSGDSGPATEAALNSPRGVAADDQGNVYITDSRNYRIRKVAPDGIIETIAGTGISGFGWDGGPANGVLIGFSVNLTPDSLGQLYISDGGNGRVRRINNEGIIDTVAGRNYLLGDGGPATAANLSSLRDVVVDDQGNLYISDRGNNTIRKVSASGIIRTIAGTGDPGFSGDGGHATEAKLTSPRGIALDSAGNIYLADTGNQRIRRIDPAGTIRTVVGNGVRGFSGDGGDALLAAFEFPVDVAVDSMGNIYVADIANERIRMIDAAGQISTIAGNGERGFSGDGGLAPEAQLCSPRGLTVDSFDNLYVADSCNRRVRQINRLGRIRTVAGNGERGFDGDGRLATQAQLASPWDVTLDEAGNIYIADLRGRARKITVRVGQNAILSAFGVPDGIIQTIAGGGQLQRRWQVGDRDSA